MKAIYRHHVYVVRDTEGNDILLLDDASQVQRIPLSDADLVIDPTDGDLDHAQTQLEIQDACAGEGHVGYLTLDRITHEHECSKCKARFFDKDRPSRGVWAKKGGVGDALR